MSAAPPFTDKQGQYLAFIYAYSRIFRQPPAEADMQRHFQVSPPSVHQMVLTLERAGLIRRTPGVARSVEISGRARGPPSPPLNFNPSKPLCGGTSTAGLTLKKGLTTRMNHAPVLHAEPVRPGHIPSSRPALSKGIHMPLTFGLFRPTDAKLHGNTP